MKYNISTDIKPFIALLLFTICIFDGNIKYDVMVVQAFTSSVSLSNINIVGRTGTYHPQQQQQQQQQEFSVIGWMSTAPSDSASSEDDNEDFSELGYGSISSSSGSSTTTATMDDVDDNPTTIDGMISKLFNMIPTNSFLLTNNKDNDEIRAKINEVIVKLEKTVAVNNNNVVPKMTSSPLLNGIWELKYVGGYTTTPFSISPTRQLALFLYNGDYSPGVRIFF
jgi:hypothetical protein